MSVVIDYISNTVLEVKTLATEGRPWISDPGIFNPAVQGKEIV
jgi:hypothetical protein